jgi:hypothetical protein
MLTGRVVLVAVAMLAASVWVGSLVSLAVVSAAARRTLDARSRVALFRTVGRTYQYVGTGSLLLAIGIGLGLGWPVSELDGGLRSELVLGVVLVLVSVLGMAQAKRMTVARRRALEHSEDAGALVLVRRGARTAAALRGLIATVTLAMVLLGADLLLDALAG